MTKTTTTDGAAPMQAVQAATHRISKGCGYWDITVHPYGGEFHRSAGDTLGRITGDYSLYGDGSAREYRMQLTTGRIVAVKREHVEALS